MRILQYDPEFGRLWIGCSFDEVETLLFPHMSDRQITEYIREKKYNKFEERSEEMEKYIKELYGINELPEAFATITRDLEVEVYEDPNYPDSAAPGAGIFEMCDQIEIRSLGQLKRLRITHDDGVPFPDQPAKRKLFFDMDGTLVDFKSGVRKVNPNTLAQYDEKHYDDIESIFALMEPMPGAIEAAKTLSKYYDCHIVSTAPWANPGAFADKVNWVKKYLGDVFCKKVTLTHHKELLNDGDALLIDDRPGHGADTYGDNRIPFDSDAPDWKGITERLVAMAEAEGVIKRFK